MRAMEDPGPRAAELMNTLGATADGMVAVAPGGRILTWNEGAATLLGFSSEEVVGRTCFEVFGWLDRCGNPICSAFCPHCRASDTDEIVQTRDVIARAKSGRTVWLSVSTLVPPPELRGDCRLIHLFREVGLPPELERLVAERLQPESAGAAELAIAPETIAALGRLTPREREVLQLIADGADTKEIAQRLTLSLTTVRNHVQNILSKLGVHTKLEAAVLFVRHGSSA